MMNAIHETGAFQPTLKSLRQEVEKLADSFLAGEGRENFSAEEMFALIRVVVKRSPSELRGLMYPYQQT